MPQVLHPLPDRLAALAFLGQALCLEWQAVAGETVLTEWSRNRDGLGRLNAWFTAGPEDTITLASAMGPLGGFVEIAAAWLLLASRSQLALAHGLINQCALPYLDLPRLSGRRTGFDPGRRRNAVVIDFPDRRKPDPYA